MSYYQKLPLQLKTYKIITNTYFLIFNFIFIILVSVISKNNIDIFAKESLFTNNNTLVLLELSTLLFFIYIVLNSLVYFTNSLIMYVGDKKVSNSKELYNNEIELINPEVSLEQEEVKQPVYTPNITISFQELVNNINDVKEEVVTKVDLVPEMKNFNNPEVDLFKNIELIKEDNNNFKFIDPVLFEEPFGSDIIETNREETLKEKLNFVDFNILETKQEDKLTLNDYKLFSNMLKTVIQNNATANLTITDILNKNLLTKYSFEEYTKFEKILNACLN